MRFSRLIASLAAAGLVGVPFPETVELAAELAEQWHSIGRKVRDHRNPIA